MSRDAIEAVAAATLAHLDSDKAKREPVDPRSMLSPAQLRIWDYAGRRRKLLCGRRAGKTFVLILRTLWRLQQRPNSMSLYLALNKNSARLIAWPVIREVAERLGIPSSGLHEHTLTVDLDNGSKLVLAGTDDSKTIESFRGLKLLDVVIDEMGSQPESYIKYTVGSILIPCLLDLRGDLTMAGTPGIAMRGYWYEQTRDDRDESMFRWTCLDNPFLGDGLEQALEEIRAEEGWTVDSTPYLREWLAQWVEDAEGLVFPLSAYNIVPELPTHSLGNAMLPLDTWRHVLAIDVGQVDDTALVHVAGHPLDTREVVVSAEKYKGMLVAQLAQRIREYRAKWPRISIVLDSGGMGKQHAAELAARFGIYLKPAQKTEKASQIRLNRDGVLSGKIVLLDGPACDPLREELSVLMWDLDREKWKDGPADHATDAWIYAHRELRQWVKQPALADQATWMSDEDRWAVIAAGFKIVRERSVRARIQAEKLARNRGW